MLMFGMYKVCFISYISITALINSCCPIVSENIEIVLTKLYLLKCCITICENKALKAVLKTIYL